MSCRSCGEVGEREISGYWLFKEYGECMVCYGKKLLLNIIWEWIMWDFEVGKCG